MLQLDYALLCDYVRAESGVAHVIAAGIDSIYRSEVPAVANLGLLARVTFTDDDIGQDHQFEVRLVDPEGQQVARVTGTPPLAPMPGLPEGWPYGGIFAINFGVTLPRHGPYQLHILLDGAPAKTTNLRDTDGRLIGVELIRPARPWPLAGILGRFPTDASAARLLRLLERATGDNGTYTYAEPAQLINA
jgi:hypothetical protein